MPVKLRPYQTEMVEEARAHFRAGMRAVLMHLATGGGKTVLGSFMVNGSQAKGNVCWWLVHRRELLSQASKTFFDMGIDHGIVAGGKSTDPRQRVQIGSIQTVARRLDKLPAPDLIVFDETHHLGAAQWQQVWDEFPRAHKIGLTATPWRLDGVGLGRWYQQMVQGPTPAELMELGSLSGYRLFAPSIPDTTSVATAMGDYRSRDLATIMDKPAITGDCIQHYRQLAHGKRAVAFAVSIEHSRNIVSQFREAGINAEHVDGEMDHAERDRAVARFVAGQTLVLSNADLLGEGFDVPAIEAAILLRPTQSLSLHLQQIGRALRPADGKGDAIILDHAGNCARHGLPDDDREWSLADREKRKKKSDDDAEEVKIKRCAECFMVFRPAPKCPGCGFAAPVESRQIEQREGELVEINRDLFKEQQKRQRSIEERDCHTLEDWQRLAVSRGYKPAWAVIRFQQRQRRAA